MAKDNKEQKESKEAKHKCLWCSGEFPGWMNKCPRCGWEVGTE